MSKPENSFFMCNLQENKHIYKEINIKPIQHFLANLYIRRINIVEDDFI